MQDDAEKSIDYSDKKELPPPLAGGVLFGERKKIKNFLKGNPD